MILGELVFNHTVLREDLSVRKSEGQIAEILAEKERARKEGKLSRGATMDSAGGWVGRKLMQHFRSLRDVLTSFTSPQEAREVIEKPSGGLLRGRRKLQGPVQ